MPPCWYIFNRELTQYSLGQDAPSRKNSNKKLASLTFGVHTKTWEFQLPGREDTDVQMLEEWHNCVVTRMPKTEFWHKSGGGLTSIGKTIENERLRKKHEDDNERLRKKHEDDMAEEPGEREPNPHLNLNLNLTESSPNLVAVWRKRCVRHCSYHCSSTPKVKKVKKVKKEDLLALDLPLTVEKLVCAFRTDKHGNSYLLGRVTFPEACSADVAMSSPLRPFAGQATWNPTPHPAPSICGDDAGATTCIGENTSVEDEAAQEAARQVAKRRQGSKKAVRNACCGSAPQPDIILERKHTARFHLGGVDGIYSGQ